MVRDTYEAVLKDNSLETLVGECLKLLEYCFDRFDHDGAKAISFDELARGLSVGNFTGTDEMRHLFNQVDLDGSNALEFSEFLALIYLWASTKRGDVSCFFHSENNRKVVVQCFVQLQRVMLKYDADGSHRLSRDELDNLFREAFPRFVENGLYQSVLVELFPDPSRGLSLRTLMYLLYGLFCRSPSSVVKGCYLGSTGEAGVGSDSTVWKELYKGFKVLENDFMRIDANASGVLCWDELLTEVSVSGPSRAKIDFVSRLQGSFAEVDLDESKCLDFFEFVLLGYKMSAEGSYGSLISKCANPGEIKKAYIDILTMVNKEGKLDGQFPLETVRHMCTAAFNQIPPNLDAVVAASAPGTTVLSMLQLLKLLYKLVLPMGSFDPATYVPIRREVVAENVSKPDAPASRPHPPRINPVIVAKFRPTKLLGEGGQGRVSLGEYDSLRVAGKVFLGDPDQELVDEVMNELEFFTRLDHPNCHYLLGAKTTLDNGGILVLTEVCDKGSLFDLYYKHHTVIDRATAWRFAKECAQGFGHIHGMGYMHRDIKSLNVFLTGDLVCQVADFGMCTNEETTTVFMGTGQWMAPEVGAHGIYASAPPYDKKCDVYSYAVLLWEMFHSTLPYSDTRLDQMEIIRAVVRPEKKFRPTINARKCPPEIVQVMERCWAHRPADRPTFDQVCGMLDTVRSAVH